MGALGHCVCGIISCPAPAVAVAQVASQRWLLHNRGLLLSCLQLLRSCRTWRGHLGGDKVQRVGGRGRGAGRHFGRSGQRTWRDAAMRAPSTPSKVACTTVIRPGGGTCESGMRSE